MTRINFLRKRFVYEKKKTPPFVRLIAFIISSKNEEDGFLEAQKIKKNLLSLKISKF